MTDRSDDERAHATPVEGVRILGAEEARAALGEHARERRHEEPEAGESEGGDEPGGTAAHRLPVAPPPRPRWPEEGTGPTWSATDVGESPAAGGVPSGDVSSEEVPPLPHWTEPPTGAIPAIFADDEGAAFDDPDDPWATVSGAQPRFRAEGSDWAEADFGHDDLADETSSLGALAEAVPVDDDEEFEQQLAQRRRTPRGRAPRTMVTTPAPAAPTPAAPAPGARRPRPRPAAGSPPAAGRDLPTAVVTAGVLVVVALISFVQGTFWTTLLASAILGVGALELSAALRVRGLRPAAPLVLVGTVLLPVAARQIGGDAYPVFFGLMVVTALLWFLFEVTPGRPMLGVATTVFAFMYVGGLGGFAGLLLASRDGVGLIIGVVACVAAHDAVGYFVGSQFGKSPVAPRISPHKTFEGTVAGMAASVFVGWVIIGGAIGGGVTPWSPGRGAVLGLFVAAGAFLGDLCESMLKRDLGIKDFGSLLPGHGGVLDRFDALLFCLPITYYLALHFNIL